MDDLEWAGQGGAVGALGWAGRVMSHVGVGDISSSVPTLPNAFCPHPPDAPDGTGSPRQESGPGGSPILRQRLSVSGDGAEMARGAPRGNLVLSPSTEQQQAAPSDGETGRAGHEAAPHTPDEVLGVGEEVEVVDTRAPDGALGGAAPPRPAPPQVMVVPVGRAVQDSCTTLLEEDMRGGRHHLKGLRGGAEQGTTTHTTMPRGSHHGTEGHTIPLIDLTCSSDSGGESPVGSQGSRVTWKEGRGWDEWVRICRCEPQGTREDGTVISYFEEEEEEEDLGQEEGSPLICEREDPAGGPITHQGKAPSQGSVVTLLGRGHLTLLSRLWPHRGVPQICPGVVKGP